MLKCYDLTVESLVNPVGIDTPKPRFSWKVESNNENVFQTEYEIEVQGMWRTHFYGEQSLYVDYNGKPLAPKTRYDYKVRVCDNHGELSDYTYGYFITGFMGEIPSAKWIGRK